MDKAETFIELGNQYRNDWSEVDGRTLQQEFHAAALIIKELEGDVAFQKQRYEAKEKDWSAMIDVNKVLQTQVEALEAQQEWISVDDRLPCKGDKCLVCNITEEGVWYSTCEYKGYWPYVTCPPGNKTVSHWMPLPQPPQGE